MKPTASDLEKLYLVATLNHTLDKYVWLREDEKGRYIEYAFIPGRPHDCRCLSWYDNPHPTYPTKFNGGYAPPIISKVGELYKLAEYCCGNQGKTGPEHCSAGHPSQNCGKKHWTYREPVKCACWKLDEAIIPATVEIPIDKALKLKDKLLRDDC